MICTRLEKQGIKVLTNSKLTELIENDNKLTLKLENIGIGVTEIKSEINNIKSETKDNRERLIKVEESAKQAHKRLDSIEPFLRRRVDDE